ncbi:MAG TPA: HEPN domain-containing protein [Candidatus Lokiarchaeia archaeon]|nr:HEPN domain-containing protein [Candidatus Lokiarchaeia archaeon]
MGDRFENWLNSAHSDLNAAKLLLSDGQYHLVAFFAQQATEKAVKAILYRNNESPWGHSLADLISNNDFLEDIQNLPHKDRIPEFDMHYIMPRYPDAVPNGNSLSVYTEPLAQSYCPSRRR